MGNHGRTTPASNSAMANAIVARFVDGRVVKGMSLDVDPARPTCHVRTLAGEMLKVELRELKALFFVHSLDGDRDRKDSADVERNDPRVTGSKVVKVRFNDGEEIVGIALRFPPNRPMYFLTPVDKKGNNVRILVNSSQVKEISLVDPTSSD